MNCVPSDAELLQGIGKVPRDFGWIQLTLQFRDEVLLISAGRKLMILACIPVDSVDVEI